MTAPTLFDIAEQLRSLIAGTADRREVSLWARQWLVADDPGVDDDVIWEALERLGGADLKAGRRNSSTTRSTFTPGWTRSRMRSRLGPEFWTTSWPPAPAAFAGPSFQGHHAPGRPSPRPPMKLLPSGPTPGNANSAEPRLWSAALQASEPDLHRHFKSGWDCAAPALASGGSCSRRTAGARSSRRSSTWPRDGLTVLDPLRRPGRVTECRHQREEAARRPDGAPLAHLGSSSSDSSCQSSSPGGASSSASSRRNSATRSSAKRIPAVACAYSSESTALPRSSANSSVTTVPSSSRRWSSGSRLRCQRAWRRSRNGAATVS